MADVTRLGEFLQARRAQLNPEDVGLPGGARRRVPGLRREELAQLAGVSPSYYARLEQGQSRHASTEVLHALASALRLGDDEREHLCRLAAPAGRRSPRRRPAARVHAATRDLIMAMDVPAWVQGRHTDILAWNPRAHALLAGHLAFDAPAHVETRPTMAGLVGELSVADPAFAELWADHRIRACDAAAYVLHHPAVGTMTVAQQSFAVVAAPDQSLLTMNAADPTSADALALLSTRDHFFDRV